MKRFIFWNWIFFLYITLRLITPIFNVSLLQKWEECKTVVLFEISQTFYSESETQTDLKCSLENKRRFNLIVLYRAKIIHLWQFYSSHIKCQSDKIPSIVQCTLFATEPENKYYSFVTYLFIKILQLHTFSNTYACNEMKTIFDNILIHALVSRQWQ